MKYSIIPASIICALMFASCGDRSRLNVRYCQTNLKAINLALEEYASQYGGMYPVTDDGLLKLVELGYLNKKNLHCPETGPRGFSSYDYTPGLNESQIEVICRDKANNHAKTVNILLSNGMIHSVDRTEYETSVRSIKEMHKKAMRKIVKAMEESQNTSDIGKESNTGKTTKESTTTSPTPKNTP